MERNVLDASAQKYIATKMNISTEDKAAALQTLVGRLGDEKIKFGLQRSPKDDTWSFSSVDNGTMRANLLEGKYAKGAEFHYVYAPQDKKDKNPIWVQITYPISGGGSYIGFVPLEKWTSTSDASTINNIHMWATENRNVVDRCCKILNIPNDATIEDLNKKYKPLIVNNKDMSLDEKKVALETLYELIDAIGYLDFALKKMNTAASSGNSATRKIKQVIDDIDKSDKQGK